MTWKADIAKIIITCEKIIAVSCFSRPSMVDVWQVSEYPRVLNSPGFDCVSSSEYARVLDVPGFWMCLWFWICQDFEYIRVLDNQGYTRYRMCLNNSLICPIMSGYVWICRDMLEYAWICLNLQGWLSIYISPFPHLFHNSFPTWTRGYLFERL